VGVEIAPGLARGLVTAEHGHRLEGAEAREAGVVGEQELAAPDLAVRSIAQAVEHDAEHRRAIERPAVLGKAARHMRVVMLHLDEGKLVPVGCLAGECGAAIAWVKIGGKQSRFGREHLAIERERARVVGQGVHVVEIADVLGEHDLSGLRQGEGRFEIAAEGQDLGRALEPFGKADGSRCVAACAAQDANFSGREAYD